MPSRVEPPRPSEPVPSTPSRRRWRPELLRALGVGLLPAAWAIRQAAFSAPVVVETYYSRAVYPRIVAMQSAMNGWLPWSLAEVLIVVAVAGLLWRARRRPRRGRLVRLPRGGAIAWRAAAWRLAARAWVAAGVVAMVFVLAWGLNYARPPLERRLGLDTRDIVAEEVLRLARATIQRTNVEHERAAAPDDLSSTLPADLALDATLDAALTSLDLPGDGVRRPSPAKPLGSSTLFAYLGISGVYVPFTGEPSYNRLVPDASMPVTVAHEKAHQRGITDEGEANLVAVLACAAADESYVRYAAYLYAASMLTGAAGVYAPDAARAAWAELGPGPRADVAAIREFWEAYRGRATRVAARVNDAYLRSNRVPDGVQSYGHVVRLLIGAWRAGHFSASD